MAEIYMKNIRDWRDATLMLMARSLKNIESMLKKKDCGTLSGPLKTGLIGGLVRMDERPAHGDGSPHGRHGSVKISNGMFLKINVKRDSQGIALVPQLKGRDWQLIDAAIASERYDYQRLPKIIPKDEVFWGGVLVQGVAALEVSPFEHTITRLTRLKLQKPTQAMDENAVAVFLEDLSEHLERRKYSYHAINEGIIRLIEREEDKFFPTMKVLLKYIHPVHWQLKQRLKKLEEILKQNHKKNILPLDNKVNN
jgi:hypothetical protein